MGGRGRALVCLQWSIAKLRHLLQDPGCTLDIDAINIAHSGLQTMSNFEHVKFGEAAAYRAEHPTATPLEDFAVKQRIGAAQ